MPYPPSSNADKPLGSSNQDEVSPLLQKTYSRTEDATYTTEASASTMNDNSNDADNNGNGNDNGNTSNTNMIGVIVETIQEAAESVAENAHALYDHAQDMAVQVKERTEEAVQQLQKEFYDEAAHVEDAFTKVLEQAHDSDFALLDMGLTRSLSILPDDVAHLAVLVHNPNKTDHDDDNNNNNSVPAAVELKMLPDEKVTLPVVMDATPPALIQIPITAYLVLALATLGLASVGPMLQLQGGCSPLMKIVWRQAGTVLLLLPFGYQDLALHGWPRLFMAQWIHFVVVCACYAAANICFVSALDFTAVGNVVIFANSQAILLLVGKVFCGSAYVSYLEGLGALTAFTGAILCSKDSAGTLATVETADTSSSSSSSGRSTLAGDGLGLLCGIAGCGYLIGSKASRSYQMSLFQFMFLTMFIATMMIIVFQVVILRETVTFGMDATTGVWGFLVATQADRLPLEAVNVIVCNIVGAFGYVQAMKYFDSIVIAVAGLMQPVVAQFVAAALAVGVLPGWLGWLGNALVALGTFAVVYRPPHPPAASPKDLPDQQQEQQDGLKSAKISSSSLYQHTAEEFPH